VAVANATSNGENIATRIIPARFSGAVLRLGDCRRRSGPDHNPGEASTARVQPLSWPAWSRTRVESPRS